MSQINHRQGITIVHVDKPLRQDEIKTLQSRIELSGDVLRNVIVDLTQTPLIDGVGLEWLEQLDSDCVRLGGCVRLCGAGELCSDILRVTGVDERLERYQSLSAALASFH